MLRKRYRNEWKYLCGEKTRTLLYERLRQVLIPDEHSGPDESYTVHSLYFDDLTDSCAQDNEAGTDPRKKYRIRCYGEDTGSLHLERKEKVYGKSRKLSCPLSREEYRMILDGEAPDLYWQTKEDLTRRLCAVIMTRFFSPKIALEYNRTALIDPAINVRITMDSSIFAAASTYGFPTPDGSPSVPLLSEKDCILEVKFDDILPGWLHTLLESVPLQQIPFSKYYLGRKKLEEMYR